MLQAAATEVTTHRALETLDIGIIAVYFLIVFAIGYYFARARKPPPTTSLPAGM